MPKCTADFTAPINHSLGSINDVLTAYAELLHAEDEFTRLQASHGIYGNTGYRWQILRRHRLGKLDRATNFARRSNIII